MKTLLLVSVFLVGTRWTSSEFEARCRNKIYCRGPILPAVQRARLFADSKTFVDMKMLQPPDTILGDFEILLKQTNKTPSKTQLKEFVDTHFVSGDEFEAWTPPDYKSNPRILGEIGDIVIRDFTKTIISKWPDLSRKIKQDVHQHPDQYSLIPLPNGFVVPGGRFREIYYWDSYWIIKGLLISEMTETVRGMLENLLHLVKLYGFVPNGSRVYYLNRSQPPLLIPMVSLYINATKDLSWLRRNIQLLEDEAHFWLREKTVNVTKDGVTYTLCHYNTKSNTPRPESYLEDIYTASYYKDEESQERCYTQIKSGAESGWDFSSRWIFDKNGGISGNLSLIETTRVLPVDLNAYICGNFKLLQEFYDMLGVSENSKYWYQKHEEWKLAIDKVLYDEQDGIWYDYDSKLGKQRKGFYPSNMAPLWARAVDPVKMKELADRVADYFIKSKIDQFQGGVPTSLVRTGEQWDFPNVWPPMQSIVIFGFEKSGSEKAKNLARSFAKNYLAATVKGYRNTQALFEKYDAVHVGRYGGGGEYAVQEGFGWTNGVALEIIDYYYRSK